MEVLEDRISRRRAIFAEYQQSLEPISAISFPQERSGARSNRWLTIIRMAQGGWERLHEQLKAHAIESRPVWKPLHLQPAFSGVTSYLNGVSETLFSQCLCLPSGSAMTGEQIQEVVEIIKKHQSL